MGLWYHSHSVYSVAILETSCDVFKTTRLRHFLTLYDVFPHRSGSRAGWAIRTWEPTCTPGPGDGRLSFISATPGGRSLQYQGWRWMPWMVIRLLGSGTRIFVRRSRSSRDTLTCAGKSYSTFRILCTPYNQHLRANVPDSIYPHSPVPPART